MNRQIHSVPTGFHAGELAVQRRAGVATAAARLTGMLAPPDLRGGLVRFLAERTFAALTARDHTGRLWISPLTGPPGFLAVTSATTLSVHAAPVDGDPLHALPPGQPVGLLVIEFAARRRVRLNGTLTATDGGTLHIDVDQAYGNCPQYIQRRTLTLATPGATTAASSAITTAAATGQTPDPVRHGAELTSEDVDLIRRSDTFLIGTTHPTRGNDASHRGGPPGFVRTEGADLWWPDYQGNNMFNTLGNLAVDPAAALLFCDFRTGRTLHLSGTAAAEWTTPGIPGDDDDTGRRVRFSPQALIAGRLLPLRADTVAAAPDNPTLTDRAPTPGRTPSS